MRRNLFLFIAMMLSISSAFSYEIYLSQVPDSSDFEDAGIAVSPSHMNFNLKPGETRTQKLKIVNDTKKSYTFKVTQQDYSMNYNGKSEFGENTKRGLSKWMNVSPSYFEIMPGEKKDISIIVTIPNTEEANIAVWNALFIEQVKERTEFAPDGNTDNTIAMGILPTFSFGVWVYQNPPNVAVKKVKIMRFSHELVDDVSVFHLDVHNEGDGISFINSYIEFTNLKTGKQTKMPNRNLTILPEQKRSIAFMPDGGLKAGTYSVIGVVDYGSEEEVIAAEIEVNILTDQKPIPPKK